MPISATRKPHVACEGGHRADETPGRDTDDREPATVDRHGAADNVAVGAVAAPPEPVAQHDRLLVVRVEEPPDLGSETEDTEVVAARPEAVHGDGALVRHDGERGVAVRGEILEDVGRRFAVRLVTFVGEESALHALTHVPVAELPDRHDVRRLSDRRWSEEDGVRDAEHGGHGADPHGDRHGGYDRERGIAP